MKFLLSIYVTLIFCVQLSASEVWPDGSKIGSWFKAETMPISGSQTKRFVVTDYGVEPDSPALQTQAIQKVIDLAAENGGTVVVPKGVFLTSSLFFKSGTHLYLEEGSVLKGSDDVSDFAIKPVHIEGVLQPYVAALINAYDVDTFSIRGKGTLDGNGLRYWKEFWLRHKINPKCTNLEALRPRMIYVSKGKNIHIEGVTIANSPFWNVHLYKCESVRIFNATITAPNEPVPAPSSDGIDIDACNNVHIKGCRIAVNDDSVCLKGGKGPWAHTDPNNGTNSNILVENCNFDQGHAILTFGSECIAGRNVILRNSTVNDILARGVLRLKMRPDTKQNYEYVLVENIVGQARFLFYVAPWTQFFDLKGHKGALMSCASNITIRNCKLKCETGISVKEQPDQYKLSNIVIENNDITEIKPNK